MGKELEVQVQGKNFMFDLPSDLKPEDFLQIVDYVEHKMNKIKSAAANLDTFKLGLLTALNIAEELITLKRENENLKEILEKIDKMLTPPEGGTNPGKDDGLPIQFSS